MPISGSYVDLNRSGAPAGAEGRVYYDSTNKKLYYHDGTGWKEFGGADVRILEDNYIELFKAGDPRGLKVWTYAGDLVYLEKLTWDDVAKFANDVKDVKRLAFEFNGNVYFFDDEIASILNSANLAADKAASVFNSRYLAVDKVASIADSTNITSSRIKELLDTGVFTDADKIAALLDGVITADDAATHVNSGIYSDDLLAFAFNSTYLAVDKAAYILNSANLAADKAASILNSDNLAVDKAASILSSTNITSSKVRQILLNPNLSAMRTAEIFAKLSNTRKNEIATYVDEFDTLNTDYWTHREGTSVQVSTSAAYSGSSGLRLYYEWGTPYHADVAHAFAVARNEVIAEVYWRNTSSDTSDPDRGGVLIETAIHETGFAEAIVYPDKIEVAIEEAKKIIKGSFTNVWKQITIVIKPDNTAAVAIDGVCELSGSVTNTAGAVRLIISGYSHEEHADLFRIIEPS